MDMQVVGVRRAALFVAVPVLLYKSFVLHYYP